MRKLLAFCLMLVLLVSLAACGSKEKNDDSEDDGGSSDIVSTGDTDATSGGETDSEKTVTVSTPYADLKVPASFEGKVDNKVSTKDPYTVTFFAADDDTELFSVIFNGEGDILLGTIIGEDENTVVHISYAELNKDDKNFDTYSQYQEQADTIVNHLKNDYEFVINHIVEHEDDTTFDIKTDFATLKYPARWKDKVTVDVTEEVVGFSWKDVKLFDISLIKTENGLLLGKYREIPLYLVTYDLKKGKMSEDTFAELNMMQEDYSVILNHLIEDPNFVLNSN